MKEHWKTTWIHIRRSPYQTLAAIGIMVLTFFLSSIIILVAAGSQTMLKYFETRPQVTAFFKDEIKMSQVEALQEKLNQTKKIKQLKYVSKEEALVIYREQNKNDPLLLEMVTANILPASLEVSTIDISYLEEIAQILRTESGVEEVIFQEEVVKTLKSWTNAIRKIGIVLVAFLGIISLLIVLIIVGMKVALRKGEVETLSLIGANNWYIRIPFVLEGAFYGIVGAFLGWGIAFLLLLYSTPFLLEFFAGISLLPVPLIFIFTVLGGEIAAGILIGSLGSLLAIKKYLK